MCGIVGIAGPLNRERLAAVVETMTAALIHRGPDDKGAWVGENFAFGMRRLSIIDLTGGAQPMWDSQTELGVVYNGEVYNYRTLRAGLQNAGVSFQTESDTEVVLKSLALRGVKAVQDWNGMFAVAAWDERKKRVLLIRDRLGVKPLYYFWDGTTFMFASEIKALLASNLFPRRLNRDAIWHFLTYRYVPGPETIWHNIWKLPPGHTLELSQGGKPIISRYWKADVLSAEGPVDIAQKTREFEDLFLNSVEMRLESSDVPVGLMLSGGLDSSAVAAAAVDLGHKQFHTFSVGFSDGGDSSELGYARKVAAHLGLANHEVVMDRPGFLAMLPEAVRAADEPLADLTTVPLLALSRLARERVPVVLSGEGADEILAGYNFESVRRRYIAIKRIQGLPASILKPIGKALGLFSAKYGEKFARIATIPLPMWNVAHKAHMTQIWSESEKNALWPTFAGPDSDSILRGMYAETASLEPLDQILFVYQQSWLVEDLLMKADKMTMAASLELREPFLDYKLVEWANRQSADVKIGYEGWRYVTKRVLRRFAQKRLPREIIRRPKRGFSIPVNEWFQESEFSRWAWEHLMGPQSKLKNIFRHGEMERHLRRAAARDRQAADKIWLLIVLETWLREFDVDLADEKPAPADTTSVVAASDGSAAAMAGVACNAVAFVFLAWYRTMIA